MRDPESLPFPVALAYAESMVIQFARARVKHPGGTIFPARFVYHSGRAAVWIEDRATHTANRVLFAPEASVTKPRTGRLPYTVTTPEGDWEVKQEHGGGCGCRSPLKNIPLSKLLDPETTEV